MWLEMFFSFYVQVAFPTVKLHVMHNAYLLTRNNNLDVVTLFCLVNQFIENFDSFLILVLLTYFVAQICLYEI